MDRQPCVIGGPHKSGKTQLAVELGVSLATCRPFLNTYKVRNPVRVMMLSGESGPETLTGYLCRAGSVPEFRLYDRMPSWSLLSEMLMEQPAEVVIIDPLYLAVQGEQASNLFVMGKQLAELSSICLDLGATPILVHHTTEGVRPGATPSLDNLAFAGIKQFARQWLLLNRRRAFTPGPDHLWMMAGGSAGHATLVGLDHTANPWTWTVHEAEDVKKADSLLKQQSKKSGQPHAAEGRITVREERILATLREANCPAKASQLKRTTKMNGSNLTDAVESLLRKGLIRRLPDKSYERIPQV